MPEFQSLPGFRDFYPEDFAARAHIFAAWREASRRFGFEEYDGPPLEPLELYIEKSGEEIVGQLYTFEDRGGRHVALRPEMTPTLARMAGSRARGLPKPLRWFSLPQLFRYERTQRGRLREHFQWNADIVGEAGVGADAEILAVGLEALRLLGLTAEDIVARVNDRRLLERLLRAAGVPQNGLAATYAAVDKLGREPAGRIRERLTREAGLNAAIAQCVLDIFETPELEQLAERHAAVPGVPEEVDRLREYFRTLDDLGFREMTAFDARIVRGLAYYTGIVFEIFDRRGELRAVCGGGRYDQLLGAVSVMDLPAAGFGMGDVVLRELLAERGKLPEYSPKVDYYLVAIGDAEQHEMLRLAERLRANGHSVVYALRSASVGRQFKEAAGRGARRAVVLGPEEMRAGVVLVRDMASGAEERVPPATLLGGVAS
jgi:histidyl-tRNA synthetase